jgi:hypothetical protein
MVVPASSPTRVDVVTPAEFSTVVVLAPVIVVLVGCFVVVVSGSTPIIGIEMLEPKKFEAAGDASFEDRNSTSEDAEKNSVGIPD